LEMFKQTIHIAMSVFDEWRPWCKPIDL